MHLAVILNAQGRGIGRSLVTELYRIAKTRNCRIYTIARNTSVGFFKRLGFQPVPGPTLEHPVFREYGISFAFMERFVE